MQGHRRSCPQLAAQRLESVLSLISGYLGFGSNLGNRKKNLAQAANTLYDRPDFNIIRTSRIYETKPWGLTDQPNFLNMVAEIATSVSPRELLERVKRLEQDMGREEGPRFGPRLIDVDILLLEDLVVDEPDLQVPHASLHLRACVWGPLTALAPDSIHPVRGETIAQLKSQVDGLDGVTPLN